MIWYLSFILSQTLEGSMKNDYFCQNLSVIKLKIPHNLIHTEIAHLLH